MGELNN